MIDHVTLKVSNLEKSKEFYEKVFLPLGYKIAFGKPGIFYAFDIDQGLFEIAIGTVLTTTHVGLRAKDKSGVDAFYEAALKAGGRDNGAPGPRPEYTEQYYACFVLDPDGHNIEVMIM